ncbi:MAG: antitoxin VapB family protein [Nitrososphaerota archaeon]|nr:antitoxin VapB family protein [Nitrososphaerota archaeon]
MYTHHHMPSRNLAIRDDVYRKLAEAKKDDESFSEVIERLLERKGSVLPLWGALASSDALAEIERETKEIRGRALIRE